MDVQFHLKDILQTAVLFLQQAGDRKVFAFHGQMGTGKTTFIHALCDVLKVSSTVGSPTFSLINEYRYPDGNVFHIDLYRVNSEEEALHAGIEDSLYSGAICLIEWPERAPAILPGDTVHVYIEIINSNNRRLRIDDK